MSSIQYTVYFSSNDEIIPLTRCEDYNHAEDIFESDVVPAFLEKTETIPYQMLKHKEGSLPEEQILAILPPENISEWYVFIKRKHEFTVYKKILLKGRLYNSYTVKYVGKIGVLSQKRDLENASLLEIQLANCQKTIRQQEATIATLEQEISLLKSSQISHAPINSKEYVKKNNSIMGDVIAELSRFFAKNDIATKCEQEKPNKSAPENEETPIGIAEVYMV
jgi:hypothetical protein